MTVPTIGYARHEGRHIAYQVVGEGSRDIVFYPRLDLRTSSCSGRNRIFVARDPPLLLVLEAHPLRHAGHGRLGSNPAGCTSNRGVDGRRWDRCSTLPAPSRPPLLAWDMQGRWRCSTPRRGPERVSSLVLYNSYARAWRPHPITRRDSTRMPRRCSSPGSSASGALEAARLIAEPSIADEPGLIGVVGQGRAPHDVAERRPGPRATHLRTRCTRCASLYRGSDARAAPHRQSSGSRRPMPGHSSRGFPTSLTWSWQVRTTGRSARNSPPRCRNS